MTKRFRFLYPALIGGPVLLVGLSGCVSAPASIGKRVAEIPAVAGFSDVDAAIASGVAAGKYPGAVYLIAKGGKIIHYGAVGAAIVETKSPMRMDSVFRLMSMTKPVTAVAALLLVDDRKIALDDPVSHYLPEFVGYGAAKKTDPSTVTIRQLLTHTSGIGFGSIARPGETLAERVQKIASKPLPTAAGQKWQYSGYDGLDVVARIVEVVSRQPYDRFVKQRIFDPLEMEDTAYSLTVEQQTRLVGLYAATNGKITISAPPLPPTTYAGGGAGLFSTGPDYIRFAQMLSQRGKLGSVRILSSASVAELSKIQLLSGFPDLQPGLAFGLGVRVVGDPVALKSPLPSGAYGWSGAWGTHFWVDPSRRLSAVWMINTTTAGGAGSVDALTFERLVMHACATDKRCNRIMH